MKILFYKLGSPWLLILLSLAAAGCAGGSKTVSGKQDPGAQTAPYPAIVIEEAVLLMPETGLEGPVLELTLTLLDPAGEGSLQDPLLKELLFEGKSPQEYVDKLILDYQDFYREVYSSLPEDEEELPLSMREWTYEEIHRVQNYPPLRVVDRSREYYIGGAHGMQERQYFAIDLEEKQRLFLEDLFLESAKAPIKALVEDALRDYSELSPGTALSEGYYFDDSVEVPENFFLNAEGIGFHWDPYEIAPYAIGPIEVLVPYERVQGLLSPRGISLLAQFTPF